MRRVGVRPSVCLSVPSIDRIPAKRLLSIDICRRQRAAAASVLHCDPRSEGQGIDRDLFVFFWHDWFHCLQSFSPLAYFVVLGYKTILFIAVLDRKVA